jgi:hypothetical protein
MGDPTDRSGLSAVPLLLSDPTTPARLLPPAHLRPKPGLTGTAPKRRRMSYSPDSNQRTEDACDVEESGAALDSTLRRTIFDQASLS